MRWFLTWMAVGAFLGSVAATLVAPYVLETLLATTGAQDAMCQCTQLVANTASKLITTQVYGAVGGAVITPIVAHLLRRKFGKKPTELAPQAPAQP